MPIRAYLESRWRYLCDRGWQPSCGKEAYIRRNTPHVRRNVAENPTYTTDSAIRYGL